MSAEFEFEPVEWTAYAGGYKATVKRCRIAGGWTPSQRQGEMATSGAMNADRIKGARCGREIKEGDGHECI